MLGGPAEASSGEGVSGERAERAAHGPRGARVGGCRATERRRRGQPSRRTKGWKGEDGLVGDDARGDVCEPGVGAESRDFVSGRRGRYVEPRRVVVRVNEGYGKVSRSRSRSLGASEELIRDEMGTGIDASLVALGGS